MASNDEAPPIPLGAQILRKMYGGCKALGTDLSTMHGSMDESDAKNVIGEHLGTLGNTMSAIEKHFGKAYKGIDLEEAQQEEQEEAMTPEEQKAFEEGKHPRADDGKFGEGGGDDDGEEMSTSSEFHDTSADTPIPTASNKPLGRLPKPVYDREKKSAEDDDDMDPTEKAMLTSRIKMLESNIRHVERLRRVAASRR